MGRGRYFAQLSDDRIIGGLYHAGFLSKNSLMAFYNYIFEEKNQPVPAISSPWE